MQQLAPTTPFRDQKVQAQLPLPHHAWQGSNRPDIIPSNPLLARTGGTSTESGPAKSAGGWTVRQLLAGVLFGTLVGMGLGLTGGYHLGNLAQRGNAANAAASWLEQPKGEDSAGEDSSEVAVDRAGMLKRNKRAKKGYTGLQRAEQG